MDAAAEPFEKTLRLLPDLSEVTRARTFLRDVAAQAGFSAERTFDIIVAASEACANAIEHTGMQEEVIVQTGLHADRLEVHVLAPGEFRLPATEGDRRHRGLGLPLMATLADHLALYSRAEGGTLVTLTFYFFPDRAAPSALPLPQNQLELLQENVLLGAILASAPLGIFVVDPDMRLTWANEASREYLDERWELTDLLGRRVHDVLPPEGSERLVDRLREVSRTGRSYLTEETPFYGLGRGITYWCVRMLPLPVEEQGPPYDVLVLASDITDSVLVRKALAAERNRLQSVLASLTEGVVIADQNGTILLMNEEMLRLQRTTSDQTKDTLWEYEDYQVSTLEGRVLAQDEWPLVRAIRGESFTDMRLRVTNPAVGLSNVWTYAGAPVPDEDGGARLAVLTVRDITEAITAEEALRETNERFGTVLDSMTDGFVIYDSAWRTVYLNERAASQFRRDRADLLGKVVWEEFPDVIGGQFYRECHAAVRDLRPRSFLDYYQPVDTNFDIRVVPFRGGLAVFTRDVTQEVLAERERERLHEDQRETAHLSMTLTRIMTALSSAAHEEEVLTLWLAEATSALQQDSAAVALPEGDGWRVKYGVGLTDSCRGALLLPEELPHLALAVRRQIPVARADLTEDLGARNVPGQLGPRSALAVPLAVHDEVVGIVSFGCKESPRPLTPTKLDFAGRLGVGVALALDRVRLLASLQEELARATLLQEVTLAATGEPDLSKAAEQVLEALNRGMDAFVGAVRLLDPSRRTLRLVAAMGLSDDEREAADELAVDLPDSPASQAVRLGSPVTHPDGLAETERPIALGHIGPDQARVITSPLEHRGEVLGVLDLAFPGRRPFTEAEFEVIHTVSHTLAQAVAQARMLEIEQRTRQEEEQRTRLTDALSEITSAISSSLDPESVLQQVVAQGAEALGAEASAIGWLKGKVWLPRYLIGISAEVVGSRWTEEQMPFLAAAARRRQVVVVNDALRDPRLDAGVMARMGIAAVMVAPLVARGEVVGALLFLEMGQPRRYQSWEQEFASRLALAGSLALETARMFQAQKDIADVLQEALLAVPQSIPGLQVEHFYRSATQAARVGGDFYDLFLLEEGKVAALIGDVSGHGVEASSQASYVRDTVKAYLYQGLPLDRVLDLANQAVIRRAHPGSFVTLFVSVLDIESGAITYSSAGHPPPMLKRQGRGSLQLELGSSPLGIFPDAVYPVGTERLAENDLLVLFTDGLIEARQGGRMFGEAGLLRVLEEDTDDLATLGARLIREVLAYSGGHLTDDVALVLLAFLPSGLGEGTPAEEGTSA